VWLGCWTHARRYFLEAARERPRTVARILRLISRLYRWERVWDKRQIGPRRAGLRQRCFERPLRRLRQLALTLSQCVLPKSGLGQACAYLLNQWEPLTAHLGHSETRLDNNLVQNAIRPSAIGKKNWLFIGHPTPASARRSSARSSSPVSGTAKPPTPTCAMSSRACRQ